MIAYTYLTKIINLSNAYISVALHNQFLDLILEVIKSNLHYTQLPACTSPFWISGPDYIT